MTNNNKSIVTSAQETIVDAAKTSAEGVKILAGDAVKEAAAAATGVLAGVKKALEHGDKKPTKKATVRKAKKPAKKRAAAKKKTVAKKSARKAVKKKRISARRSR